MEKKELYTVNGNINRCSQYGKSMKIPQKLKIELPYDPAPPFVGIHLTETKSGSRKEICTAMLTAALFTRAKVWKQPKCPLKEEWIKIRCIYIYNGLITSFQTEENHAFTVKWMNVENIILSDVHQTKKQKQIL